MDLLHFATFDTAFFQTYCLLVKNELSHSETEIFSKLLEFLESLTMKLLDPLEKESLMVDLGKTSHQWSSPMLAIFATSATFDQWG